MLSARRVLGAVVCAANSRRAPPHAVGRGSFAPTPRRVGGGGFEPSLLTRSRPVARGAGRLRHVENQTTAHGALVSARRVLGAVVCAANSRRAPPHAVGRGSFAPTPRRVGGGGFEPSLPTRSRPVARGAGRHRHVENQPTAHRALVSARRVLGAVVCAANSRRAPPHAVGRGSFAPTPRRVGGGGFEPSLPTRSRPVARGAGRHRHVENQPTAHGATCSLRAACLARLSARPTRGALHPTPLAEAPLHRHRIVLAAAASNRRCRLVLVPWRAAREGFVTWRTRRPPTEPLVSTRRVLGAVVCVANSRRAPPHAVGRGSFAPTPRRVGGGGFEPSLTSRSRPVARGAGRLRHVENQPTAHGATCSLRAACLARLSARPTRGALQPTPLAEAPLHRHRAVLAAAASNFRCRLVLVPWRAAREGFVTWRTRRPPTEHLCLRAACLARLSARPTRGALHPTPLAEAPLHRHRAVLAAAASNRRCRLVLVPWRAAREGIVTWRTS